MRWRLPQSDHQRLHDVLVTCEGYFMVSYNYQDYICEILSGLLYLPHHPSQQHVPDGRQRI